MSSRGLSSPAPLLLCRVLLPPLATFSSHYTPSFAASSSLLPRFHPPSRSPANDVPSRPHTSAGTRPRTVGPELPSSRVRSASVRRRGSMEGHRGAAEEGSRPGQGARRSLENVEGKPAGAHVGPRQAYKRSLLMEMAEQGAAEIDKVGRACFCRKCGDPFARDGR